MGGFVNLTDPRTHVVFGIDADAVIGINVDPLAAQQLNNAINPISEKLTLVYTVHNGQKGVACALERPEYVIDSVNANRSKSMPPIEMMHGMGMHDDDGMETGRPSAAAADPETQALEELNEATQASMAKSGKVYFLRQQIEDARKMLKEMGEDDGEDDNERLARELAKSDMAPEVREEADREFARLKKMQPMAPEATVARTYIETLVAMPWSRVSGNRKDITESEKILNDEHYGLEKIKEAILDYLAVLNQPNATGQGKTLCLVGPPGVGKTSIGMSIANATDRKFQRIALGGVRDEAEIRGHRRTYIGAQMGSIAQAIKRAGVIDLVLLLDEIDKMGKDDKGDPAAALLEALDPKQNKTFKDHYLDVPLDLSKALKICTANEEDKIPEALLDRMKIIRLPGYTREQKFEIGKRYLVGRCLKETGLTSDQCEFTDAALRTLVGDYTREAGVRNLEEVISTCCAKVARAIQKDPSAKITFTPENLEGYIGAPNPDGHAIPSEDSVGIVNGLAYTAVGGKTLQIEAVLTPGKDFGLASTGNLKEVMTESVSVAHTVAQTLMEDLCAKFNVAAEQRGKSNIHVHVLAGAIPKDGPSAGAALTTAILSAITNQKVRRDVAMTGEISLHGKILPIGGLPEKLDGALRDGATTVLIPIGNARDLEKVPKEVLEKLTIHKVSTIQQVLDYAFVTAPSSITAPPPPANNNALTPPALRVTPQPQVPA